MNLNITSQEEFRTAALETFRYQMAHCEPYSRYVNLLGVNVQQFEDIPFLPIELFKTEKIYCRQTEPEAIFTSSGTSGSDTSHHYVASLDLYEESFRCGFEHFYGSAAAYSIFALLPSYMERQGSSLTLMVERLHGYNASKGGFFLYDFEKLASKLHHARTAGERILLIGVTFALLDFAERCGGLDLSGAIVMETGGMKGRRREIAREELHDTLCRAFNVETIHSEYGMTEMLSQCYSKGNGLFHAPPWVSVSTRSLQNPLQIVSGCVGGINVVDLANHDSCAFISTGDRGVVHESGSFEIHGRIESAQLRGCNMLTE